MIEEIIIFNKLLNGCVNILPLEQNGFIIDDELLGLLLTMSILNDLNKYDDNIYKNDQKENIINNYKRICNMTIFTHSINNI